MANLEVDGFTATTTDWTTTGATPYIDDYDAWASYITACTEGMTEDEFTFEDTALVVNPTEVEVQIWCDRQTSGNDIIEVWMWESIGGWAKVGELEPSTSIQMTAFTVTSKFNTIAKINEAKMRFIYRRVV
jgi:hypothetical protein